MMALMWAAREGHDDIVKYLLSMQDVDTKTPTGETALNCACRRTYFSVVKLLVKAGAKVDPQGSDEWGPLVSAAFGGSLHVVKYLVEEAGADVRRADPDGMTALMMAENKGHVRIVEYLRERQVNAIDVCTTMILKTMT
jgi:ankyrin repeat protein